ncbi:MAG TPA: sensor domain-containing diguanylate cyclase [Gaiellales bacterium]|nr:sensor domain-containing diguanylate cyclase [Gaiellales bacterium]
MSRRLTPNQRDRRELEALHRLAVELPRAASLVAATDMLAEELVQGIDRITECTISSWQTGDDNLRILSVYEEGRGAVESFRGQVFPLTDWPQSRTLLEEGRAYCEYHHDDADWSQSVREQLAEWGWRSWIALPLVVESRSVGLIEVADYGSNERWSAREIAFCQTVSSHAAMAIRNAELHDSLRRQVQHDALTGLLTHRGLHELVEAELAAAQLRGGHLSVIAIDLDDFRLVNDREGHLAGDRLLRRVAETLREQCREGEAAGRVGGDGFVVVLPGVGDEAETVARRLAAEIGRRTGTSASAGIARMRPDELDAISLIERANRGLAEAKQAGKDTFRLSA